MKNNIKLSSQVQLLLNNDLIILKQFIINAKAFSISSDKEFFTDIVDDFVINILQKELQRLYSTFVSVSRHHFDENLADVPEGVVCLRLIEIMEKKIKSISEKKK